MSLPVARLNDLTTGICSAHSTGPIPAVGYVASAAANVTAEGIPVARLGDTVISACGHTGIIASASPSVLVEGNAIARSGELVSGSMNGHLVSSVLKTSSK